MNRKRSFRFSALIFGAVLQCSLATAAMAGAETEPNEDVGQATVINAAGQYTGTGGSDGDVDYFALQPTQNGSVKLTFTAGVARGFYVYKGNQRIFYDSTVSAGETKSYYFAVKDKAIELFYVKVVSSSASSVSYSLDVSGSAFGVADKDSYEFNDTEATAKTITAGRTIAYLEADGDEDYYQLQVNQAGNLKIEFQGPSDVYFPKLSIIRKDASWDEVSDYTITGTDSGSSYLNFSVYPGTYYVKVFEYSGVNGNSPSTGSSYGYYSVFHPYVFILSGSALNSADTDSDTHEPNDTEASASGVGMGEHTGFIEAVNDIDYYALDVTQAGNVSFTLDNKASFEMSLQLKSGNTWQDLVERTTSAVGPVSVDLAVGTYYVRVKQYYHGNRNSKWDSTKPYLLTLSGSAVLSGQVPGPVGCPTTSDCGFSQADVDAAKLAGKQEGIGACQADPASCGIDSGFTQAELDAAKQTGITEGKATGMTEGKTLCKNDPSACGIDLLAEYQRGYADGNANGTDAGKALCLQNPSACGITVGGGTATCTITQVDVDNASQAGYQIGFAEGVDEGQQSCLADGTYQDGFQNGINKCLSDPASCGIIMPDDDAVKFHGGGFYRVGEALSVTLEQNLSIPSYEQVDLWIAIELPGGALLYMTDNPITPFSIEPAPFRRSFQIANGTIPVLNFVVPPDMGGDYNFYAFYTREMTPPTLDLLFRNLRFNVASLTATLSNR